MRSPLRRREYIRGRTGNSRKLIRVFKAGGDAIAYPKAHDFGQGGAPILQERGKADCRCSAPHGLTGGTAN